MSGSAAFAGAHPPRRADRKAPATTLEVADLLVAYLEQIGVEYVFGVPGGAIEPFYNALARSARRGGLRHVLARHESGAAFMADGYARETGRLGVCCATSGPGTTNLITGVACATENRVPLLAITGQSAMPSLGKRALQESGSGATDTFGMLGHCTRYNSLVSHRDQVETKLVNALVSAHQTPQGAAHLTFPVDILRSPLDAGPAYDLRSLLQPPSLLDEGAVRALCAELRRARRAVFLVGGGCGEAIDGILELARMVRALLIATPDGKGYLNPRHPAYCGVFGFAGHRTASDVLREQPDLIVAFGASLGEWTSGGWCGTILNQRLVHVDAAEDHLMRSPMARLHVRGRIRAVCDRAIAQLRDGQPDGIAGDASGTTAPCRMEDMLLEPAKFLSDAVPIKPQRLMRELGRRFPATVRFVADAGNSAAWAIHYLDVQDRRVARRHLPAKRRSWLGVTMDFAPMGWAIGAAVGMARGGSGSPVVCLTGDGSFLMNGQEITVAAQEGLTVVFVILNDSALGMVKHGQRLAGAEPVAFRLPEVDFVRFAEAMGIPGCIIRSPADFDGLDMEAVLRRSGPFVLDVRIDGEEVPPIGMRLKALGTAK
ncbi:MAG: thiamine pyrophosphate-binding protein [Sulfuricella sp.]|nr:thiamine pyrophosphate-binding protein [Sulfuricella sp.]